MTHEINLPSPRRVTSALMTVILTLLTLSVVGQILNLELGYSHAKGFIPLFFVDTETNVPTWYSSMALMFASLLAGCLAIISRKREDGNAIYWMGIWALFLLLSLDEIAMIHEMPIEPMKEAFGFSGFFGFPWVIPGAIAVAIVASIYLRFVLRCAPLVRNLIILSGIVFVGGAVGVEMVSAWFHENNGPVSWPYVITVTIEEGCEMTGIAIFIHALLIVLHEQVGNIQLGLRQETA